MFSNGFFALFIKWFTSCCTNCALVNHFDFTLKYGIFNCYIMVISFCFCVSKYLRNLPYLTMHFLLIK